VTRAYFGLAGRILGGVRTRLERYRVFGLNVADEELPAEAAGDVDRLRKLVERVFAQGRQLREENARNMDATALLEEAAGVRVRLASKDEERAQWQSEVTDARGRLMGANTSTPGNGTSAPLTTRRAQTTSAPPELSPTVSAQSTPTPMNASPAASSNTPATTANTAQPSGTSTPPANSQAATAPSGSNGAADGKPLEVGSLLPIAAQKVAPSYPATARLARVTGKVTVFLMLDEKGAVATIERTDGPQLLRRAAEDAARRWKFRPTLINGQPVRVSGFINFNFAL
jgi:TonB family protein